MSCSAARQLDLAGYGSTVIHRLDGRTKLLSCVLFILVVASYPRGAIFELIPYFAFPVVTSVLGNVPFRPALRLLLLASPFVLSIACFELVAAAFTADTRLELLTTLQFSISLVLRFVLTVTAALTLVATTSVPRLFVALRGLGLPEALITQLQFLYRYLFVLVDESLQVCRARQLRSTRGRISLGEARLLIGALLTRSVERSERIFAAMRLRGFAGNIPSLAVERFQSADLIYISGVALGCLAIRMLNPSVLIGSLLLRCCDGFA